MPLFMQLCLAVLAFMPACSLGTSNNGGGGDEEVSPDLTAEYRILFIGNSLTYVNDLPAVVKALTTGAGLPNTQVASIAYPDFGLEQHWESGPARATIAKDGWTHVVMQQGPSALETSRVNLLQWSNTFAEVIKAHGAIPGMYMVWPSTDRFFDFERVSESYRLAAQAIQGQLYPAGDAWRKAWEHQPNLNLYGADGFHPSTLGTYVAALSIVAVIFERSPVGLPTLGLATPTAAVLQQSVSETLAGSGLTDRRKDGQ